MKTFLRRHNALMTFLGAAVVAATFIYKDVLQEEQKELAETLQAAQTTFLIRESIINIDQKLLRYLPDKSGSDNGWRDHTIANYAAHLNYLYELTSQAHDSFESLIMLQEETYDNLHRLSEVIPKESLPTNFEDFQHEQFTIEARGTSALREYDFSTNLDRFRIPSTGLSEAQWAELKTIILDTEMEIPSRQFQLSQVNQNLERWRPDLFLIAEEEGNIAERRYHRFKRFSYYIYALGFVLGLAGKLAGKETSAEEGE